jgi:tetratricopeptide (TPR) repeat protein
MTFFTFGSVIGISVTDRSKEVIMAQGSRGNAQQAPAWGRRRAAGILAFVLAMLPQAGTAAPQNAAESYRQTVISIQQQIEDNNLERARTMIGEAARIYPGDGGLDNLLGVVEIQEGNTALARQSFSAAMLHQPRLVGAYLNLTRIDMQTASTDPAARAEALRLDEKIIQLEPANDEANYQIATIRSWEKSYRRSLESLAKLGAQARKQLGAEALLCADHAALGHREMTNRAAAALAANPDLTEQDAATTLPALRQAHRADLIETIYAAIAGRQTLSASGLRILGLAQEGEGKLQQSRATLESAFAADSQSAAVLVDLTRVAEAAGDHDGALGYLAHARELQPTDASLPYEFGVICLKKHLYGEGRKAIAEAVKLAPDNPDYNYGMGVLTSVGDDPAAALPYLQKFHSERPRDAAGVLALGTANFRLKDYDSASKWLKLALASAATAADAHFYLGRIARQEGHVDEAIAELRQSLSLRPDSADVLAELGQIYVGNRNYAQAAPCLEHAIQLDPDNYGANFGLLQLYARTGDGRRDQLSKRFDELKDKKDEHDREMMRVIEIRPDGESNKQQ